MRWKNGHPYLTKGIDINIIRQKNRHNKSATIPVDGHPKYGSGWMPEYIFIAETKIGRVLIKGEVVHHLDGNHKNNRPENLCVMYKRDHAIFTSTVGILGMELINEGKLDYVMDRLSNHGYCVELIRRIYIEKRPLIPYFNPKLPR